MIIGDRLFRLDERSPDDCLYLPELKDKEI